MRNITKLINKTNMSDEILKALFPSDEQLIEEGAFDALLEEDIDSHDNPSSLEYLGQF